VQGSKSYDVALDWKDSDLSMFCSCPYFDSDGPCKHLWATILEVEKRGGLSAVQPMEEAMSPDFEDDEEVEEKDVPSISFPSSNTFRVGPIHPPAPAQAPWKRAIQEFSRPAESSSRSGRDWPAKRQLVYVVESSGSGSTGHIVLTMYHRELKGNGEFGQMKEVSLERGQIASLPLAEDREIVSAIAGSSTYFGPHSGYGGSQYDRLSASAIVPHPLSRRVVELAARTGRCFFQDKYSRQDLAQVIWDDGGEWHFELELKAGAKDRASTKHNWLIEGVLKRGEMRMDLTQPRLVTKGGLVFAGSFVSPLAGDVRYEWLSQLRQSGGGIEVPADDLDELLEISLCSTGWPHLNVPEDLQFAEVTGKPQYRLRIRAEGNSPHKEKLIAEPSFDYGGRAIQALEKSRGFLDRENRRFVRRDEPAEAAAVQLLSELGVKFKSGDFYDPLPRWEVPAARLPKVVRTLVDAGWTVDAVGKVLRRPGEFRIAVSSGIDWFELHGEVRYGETTAHLPSLLEAMRRGQQMVKLDDGTYGMLPEEWLRRIGTLVGMGTPVEEHIRFRPSQAGLLDALLASEPEAKFDERFARMREELNGFSGVGAIDQPKGFVGKLRDYQREGLGWMEFLRRFSFGGCLADDMGVGKTAQVLAMLESRRGKHGPSLVVVPRSLVFNWKEEAARFTPKMRVLDYTGISRVASDFASHDLVLTTYGTLRRDAVKLKDVEFDYLVLDEAQAVKNSSTESAKAVRLLHGKHRLALSGTPVENHIGELWSLFEFLNPGMLGAASVFQMANSSNKAIDADSRLMLARALKPFILRRTKDQVVKELPAKTEQTVYCELGTAQRILYDELREHYRGALLKRIDQDGIGKSKIMVLEALLRLRQAACHPGLIDPKRAGESSAKLDTLLEQLREVIETGHKALVFSQFTSMLKLLRARLDAGKVVYEYLDGKTRNRQATVNRFQSDADCKLFLISLKAGGLGLNLTEAEYVFLLDPWWNPAVEAQAVDRAHRIGQKRSVFAYRLIARDTVEEKVLELQKTKRELAAAIIGEDNALIRNLQREDLELLLS